MTPEQDQYIREAIRGYDDVAFRLELESEFDALLAEHAEMTERLRWRKQATEPAPQTEFVIERYTPETLVKLIPSDIPVGCTLGRDVIDDSEWRPL